jgi:hypothetical protein
MYNSVMLPERQQAVQYGSVIGLRVTLFVAYRYKTEACMVTHVYTLTSSLSSGKCQQYHSLTRIANVFKSLSSWSSSEIDCMIILSDRAGFIFTCNME